MSFATESQSSGWQRINCPFCFKRTGKKDYRRSFGIRADGYYHCFKCDARGFRAGSVRQEYVSKPATHSVVKPDGFVEIMSSAAKDSLTCKAYREYLLRRGLSLEVARAAKIGCCPWTKLTGRVVVPIFDVDGSWVWYSARAISDTARQKYMYPRGNRHDCFYNPRALEVETQEPVLVVEGCFDALALWPHAVATLGSPTTGQIEQLLVLRRPVCVVFDGDAWEAGARLAWWLRFHARPAGALRLPPRCDPDQLNPEEIRRLARISLDA